MKNVEGNSLAQLRFLLNLAKWIDLAPMLENDMPRWPTHPPVVINPTVTHAHDGYYCQTVFVPEHAGAHVDSPYHIIQDMPDRTIEKYPVEHLVGPCKVINLASRDMQPGEYATADDILSWEKTSDEKIELDDIVLVNFGWIVRYWRKDRKWSWYSLNQPGLSEDVADLLLERRIRALGTDTIACGTAIVDGKNVPGPPPPNHCWIHNKLLPEEILLMECIANMDKLPNACYFIALPLKIKGGSGSPFRPVGLVF